MSGRGKRGCPSGPQDVQRPKEESSEGARGVHEFETFAKQTGGQWWSFGEQQELSRARAHKRPLAAEPASADKAVDDDDGLDEHPCEHQRAPTGRAECCTLGCEGVRSLSFTFELTFIMHPNTL